MLSSLLLETNFLVIAPHTVCFALSIFRWGILTVSNAPVDADGVEGLRPGRELPFVPSFRAEHKLDTVSEALLGLLESIANVDLDKDDVVYPLEDPKCFLEAEDSRAASALVVANRFPENHEEAWRRGPSEHCHSGYNAEGSTR